LASNLEERRLEVAGVSFKDDLAVKVLFRLPRGARWHQLRLGGAREPKIMTRLLVTGLLVGVLFGCGATTAQTGGDAALVAADDTETATQSLAGTQLLGSTLKTTGNLNLRTGPSTSYSVRAVMPLGAKVTVVDATPSGGFYNVKYNAAPTARATSPSSGRSRRRTPTRASTPTPTARPPSTAPTASGRR